jgi:hypothetical protein
MNFLFELDNWAQLVSGLHWIRMFCSYQMANGCIYRSCPWLGINKCMKLTLKTSIDTIF